MSFREISRPDASKILDFPENPSQELVVAPPPQMFIDELRFWHERKNSADREGDATARLIAQENVKNLRNAAMGKSVIDRLLAHDIYDAEAAKEWFTGSLLTLSFTRFLREKSELPTDRTYALGFDSDVAAAIDSNYHEPRKSCFHSTEDDMRSTLLVEPPQPHRTRYYEGQSIYLRATAPAQPTDQFRENFHGFYGEPFDPNKYISIVPRLKTEFWMTGKMS